MIEYCSEAEALSDIEDTWGFDDDDFNIYTDKEKKEYIEFKAKRFKSSDINYYVIIQNPRINKRIIKHLYLVNRNITRAFWWSFDAKYAMIFKNKKAATNQAKKYKYNKVRVIKISNLI